MNGPNGSVYFELRLPTNVPYTDQERQTIRDAFYQRVGEIASPTALGAWQMPGTSNPVPMNPAQMPQYIQQQCLSLANTPYQNHAVEAAGGGDFYCISPQKIVCYHGWLLKNPSTNQIESCAVPGLGKFALVLVAATPPEDHPEELVGGDTPITERSLPEDELNSPEQTLRRKTVPV